jgi:hypothetical protein
MLQDRERLAREAVRKALKNVPWLFSKEGNQRLSRAYMEREDPKQLVALAREGDKDARELLQQYAAGARRAGMHVPPELREFVLDWFIDGPPKAKSGPSPKYTVFKYSTIALLVKMVHDDHGFPIYSNPEHRGNPEAPLSACRLVAEEFGVSERYVEEIWDDRKEMATRQRPPPN